MLGVPGKSGIAEERLGGRKCTIDRQEVGLWPTTADSMGWFIPPELSPDMGPQQLFYRREGNWIFALSLSEGRLKIDV